MPHLIVLGFRSTNRVAVPVDMFAFIKENWHRHMELRAQQKAREQRTTHQKALSARFSAGSSAANSAAHAPGSPEAADDSCVIMPSVPAVDDAGAAVENGDVPSPMTDVAAPSGTANSTQVSAFSSVVTLFQNQCILSTVTDVTAPPALAVVMFVQAGACSVFRAHSFAETMDNSCDRYRQDCATCSSVHDVR